jgi:uncharacterized membrane protein (DUF373 family)
MTSSDSPRPDVREWCVRAFAAAAGIVYVGLGLLLTGIALTLLVTGFISFGRIVMASPDKGDFVELLDLILLILLNVGLLYTVKVSLRAQSLAPEPFLIVGIISVIRRVLILTAKFGNLHVKTASESQHLVIELAVSTVLILILAVSLVLLRRADATAVAKRD